MEKEPAPLTCAVLRRDSKGPGSETLHLNLRLVNRRDVPRWYVLRAYLHEELQPQLTAHLLQLCGFEAEGVHYLQALGERGGFLAFRLAAGASLEVKGFAFRSLGPPAVEVWEVSSIHAGEQGAEECFDVDLEIQGELSVANGLRRSTRATYPEKGVALRLEIVQRWENLLDG